jgi:hypothetical protein
MKPEVYSLLAQLFDLLFCRRSIEQRMVDTAGQLLIRYLLFGIVHLFILDKSPGH